MPSSSMLLQEKMEEYSTWMRNGQLTHSVKFFFLYLNNIYNNKHHIRHTAYVTPMDRSFTLVIDNVQLTRLQICSKFISTYNACVMCGNLVD